MTTGPYAPAAAMLEPTGAVPTAPGLLPSLMTRLACLSGDSEFTALTQDLPGR